MVNWRRRSRARRTDLVIRNIEWIRDIEREASAERMLQGEGFEPVFNRVQAAWSTSSALCAVRRR